MVYRIPTQDGPWPLVVVGAAATLVVGFFVVTSLRDALRRRRIGRMPITTIAAVEPGQVAKVCGLARRLGETLTAPISGRPCLAYIVRVEHYTRSSQQGYSWLLWTWAEKQADLLVEDRTGTIRLAVDLADDLELDYDREIESSSFYSLDPRIARFLRERGKEPPPGMMLRQPIRCREGVLREGQAVLALGKVDVDSSLLAPSRHVLGRVSPGERSLLTNQSNRVDASFLPAPAEIPIPIDVDVDGG